MAEYKVYKLLNGVTAEQLTGALEGYLRDQKGMIVQAGQTTGGYIIQGRIDQDGWKKISGNDLAITVQLFQAEDVLNVTIGFGKWSDKIGAGVISVLVLPLAVSAGFGAYKQRKLPKELFAFIKDYILSGGLSAAIDMSSGKMLGENEIVCRKCKKPNKKGVKFCTNCGENLIIRCPNCETPISDSDKFCSECGTVLK